jgi:TnpA family transposase
MPRMKILDASEQAGFDKPPLFGSEERKRFFEFSATVLEIAERFRTPCHRIGFLLAYGYFRATKKFYLPLDYQPADIAYVAGHLNASPDCFSAQDIPETTNRRHRQHILSYFGFRLFDQDAADYITPEIVPMAQAHLKPKLIFWHCVDLLIKRRFALPSYSQLSEHILAALNQHKRTLAALIHREMPQETRALLDSLFAQDPFSSGDEVASSHARYRLTLLKKRSQSTKPSKVRERVDDLFYLKTLYEPIEHLLSLLQLGQEGIRYYANSVIKSDIFHLARRSDEDRYVHVIAFIAHQYYRLQDNLADVLLTVVQSYQNTAAREHRDACYAQHKHRDQSLKSLLEVLDDQVFRALSDIRAVLSDRAITDAEKIAHIDQLVGDQAPALERSAALKASLEEGMEDGPYFEILESRSVRLQNRISPIVKVLNFQTESGVSALMEAILYFKDKDGNITASAPVEFLDAEQHAAVHQGGTFHISLYKAFLFMQIASALKSGTLNMHHSHKYRPLDEYMIAKARWQKEKETLLARAQLQEFADPVPLLDQLDCALYQQYHITNGLQREGANPHLKIGTNGTFTVATPKQEAEQASTALQPYFPEQQLVPLTQVLATVNRHSGFLEAFEHWQQRYDKNSATDKTLYAGIIGKGCAIGTPKIARISSQISESALNHVINWYFSLENIQAANDRVIQLLDRMELPQIYRASQDTLHTASDGQKFTARSESLNANYSYKYFGKEQGISAYTFIDERNLLWHSLVLSAAERESAYVIDGLMHNEVVKSDIHSTDTHGYSEVIFAVTYLLGFAYAPRIKNLKKQILYIFRTHPKSAHPDWKITPDKYINRAIIEETWDDILRFVATIKLKETTASELFRRLNSYSKQHQLYQGLKAFGQIIKSQFILRYIDEVEVRQAIEKQLNKVELANRFTRAVAVGDPHGVAQGEKEEQEIDEACNRLIKNSIICWNYLYLSDKLARLENQPEQRDILRSAIASHSVIAWAHINLLGEYDFSDEKLQDAFGITPKNRGLNAG